MAGETTSSTLAGYFHTQLIDLLTAPYAIDAFCSIDHVRKADVPRGTKVVAFNTITKDTALSTLSDPPAMSNVAYDTTKASATVSEVGILRQSTRLSERQNLYGPGGLLMEFLDDGVKMCLEKAETDVNAEWANASTTGGGTSGAPFTIADVGSMLAQQTINKSNGALYLYLHATAGKNLRNEVLGSGAAWLTTGAGSSLLKRANQDGYMGDFLGCYTCTNNLGVASGGDKVSAMLVSAALPGNDPRNCPTGMAIAWMPEATPIWYNPAQSGGMQVAITMAYGLVEVIDYAYTKAATIA